VVNTSLLSYAWRKGRVLVEKGFAGLRCEKLGGDKRLYMRSGAEVCSLLLTVCNRRCQVAVWLVAVVSVFLNVVDHS
jgi:hypothetical protein